MSTKEIQRNCTYIILHSEAEKTAFWVEGDFNKNKWNKKNPSVGHKGHAQAHQPFCSNKSNGTYNGDKYLIEEAVYIKM